MRQTEQTVEEMHMADRQVVVRQRMRQTAFRCAIKRNVRQGVMMLWLEVTR